MLNESDRGLADVPQTLPAVPQTNRSDLHSQLHEAVSEVLLIQSEDTSKGSLYTASYSGKLILDSEAAYELLDKSFEPLNHIPVFTETEHLQTIQALRGRIQVITPRPWWPNLLLFVLTVLSLLFVGATMEVGYLDSPIQILIGWPYMIGVVLILGTHELGHYFAARYHKVSVTLPYFIPMPIPGSFGTLGAFIQLREPMRNRKMLLDIGAAGPLAGLVMAIPILLIGLKTSRVLPLPLTDVFMLRAPMAAWVSEGNSVVYALSKILVFGRFLPDGMNDVFINQLAAAGWTGLLVTGLNLIPLGQLDGGHSLYAFIGERARLLFYPLLAILALIASFYTGWIIWIFLLILLGRTYATPFNMITPLDTRRKVIAVIMLVAFFLIFMPIPFEEHIIRSWMVP